MKARISKWGNSLAIRLPKAALDGLRVREGEAVELVLEGGDLVIRPVRPRYTLEELVGGITPFNQPEIIEFSPVGEELL